MIASLSISNTDKFEGDEVTLLIYNQHGQLLLQKTAISGRVDISKLGQGIYIVELISDGINTREKLIINK